MGYVCPEMFCPHSKGFLDLQPRSLGQEAAIKILLKLKISVWCLVSWRLLDLRRTMLSGSGFSLIKEDAVSEHLGLSQVSHGKAGDKEDHSRRGVPSV